MTKNGMKVLDSDMHLMEPVDLWERYLDAKYKADAPRGLTSENVRDLRMAHPDGRPWGVPDPRVRVNLNRGHNFNKNQGIYRDHSERGWTADVQLEAMNIEGIDVRRSIRKSRRWTRRAGKSHRAVRLPHSRQFDR